MSNIKSVSSDGIGELTNDSTIENIQLPKTPIKYGTSRIIKSISPDGIGTFTEGTPVETLGVAHGFVQGAKAGLEQFADLLIPGLYDYPQTGDWQSQLAKGVSNPVNIATAFIPGGIVASSIYGAVGDTVTDYLVRKQSDIAAEYSAKDLGEEILTGVVTGGLIKGGIKGFKALKPAFTKNAIKADEALEPVFTDTDKTFLSDTAVKTNNTFKSNKMPIDENTSIDFNTSATPEELKKRQTLDNAINNMPSVPAIDTSVATKSYIKTLPEEELTKRKPQIDRADKLLVYYENTDNITNAYQNIEYSNRVRLNQQVQRGLLDPEVKDFLSNPDNKPALFNALYGVKDDPIAVKSAQIYQNLGKTATDEIGQFTNIGYLDNRFGVQRWDSEAILKAGIEKWGNDMNAAGYKIKTSEGNLIPFNSDNAQYVYDSLVHDKSTITGGTLKKSNRVLVTDNPAGAYAMEKAYGGDKNMLEVLQNEIHSNATDITRYSMFGEDVKAIINELGNIQSYTKDANKFNIHSLSEVVLPTVDVSTQEAKNVIDGINAFHISSRALKSITNPLWQTQFVPADVGGSIASAIGQYGTDIIKGIMRGNFKELEDMAKYAKFADSDLLSMSAAMRQAEVLGNNKYLRGLSWIDAKFNGMHLADKPVRKLATFLNAIGQRELMLKGVTDTKLNPKLVKKSIGDGILPNSDILRNDAKTINNKIKTIRNNKSIIWEKYEANEKEFTKLVDNINLQNEYRKSNIAQKHNQLIDELKQHNKNIDKMKNELSELRKNNPDINEVNSLNNELNDIKIKKFKTISELNIVQKKIQTLEKQKAFLQGKGNQKEKIDLINESIAHGKATIEQIKKEIKTHDEKIKELNKNVENSFDTKKYDDLQQELISSRDLRDEILKDIKGFSKDYKNNTDLNAVIKFLKDNKFKSNTKLFNDLEQIDKETNILKKEMQEHIDTANYIDAKNQQAVNDVNPLQYRFFSKAQKGSISNIYPFLVANWVLNVFYGINLKLMKGIGKGFITSDYNMVGRNATGLAIYGMAVGLTETVLDYLRDPKKFKSNDYRETHPFAEAFIKNSATGMAIGNLYLLKMGMPGFYEHTVKAGYQYFIDNNEKAKGELAKTNSWYPIISHAFSSY